MRTQQGRGRRTVRRLLDAALQVYAEAGVEGFRMTAVTEASGVSVGSLYHHFGSFDGLRAALYSECVNDMLDALLAELKRCRTARGGVTACVRGYLRWAQENRVRALFIHASAQAGFLPAQAAAVAAAKVRRTEAIQAWLRPHIEAGRVVDLPGPLIEMLVTGPPAEATRRWLVAAPAIDLAEAQRLLPDRVWQSVRGPNG